MLYRPSIGPFRGSSVGLSIGLCLRLFLSYGVRFGPGKAALLAFFLLAPPVSADPLRLVAFGDSLTQGYGLPQGQGLVPQLSGWLQAQGAEVELVNAGVSGDTSAGGLARIDWTLAEPFDGMILALGGNDLLRGIDPAVTRTNIEGILQAAQTRGLKVLLIGSPAPSNYGPDYAQRFNAIWPELSAQYEALYLTSFFAALPSEDPARLRALFQSDGLHPNAEGVAQIVEALGPQVLALITAID